MRIKNGCIAACINSQSFSSSQRGFTLIELISFIVIISVGLVGLLSTFNQTTLTSVDPLIKVRALELAQSQLEEIIALKYDENTPVGGIPACSAATTPCLGISSSDTTPFNDVDDYDGYTDPSPPYDNYSVDVDVAFAGADLGLAVADAKLITVSVTLPQGSTISLSSYKVNF